MDTNKMNNFVQTVLSEATNDERESLKEWAIELLEIKNSNLSNVEKGKQIVSLMKDSDAIKNILSLGMAELKKIGWDDRSVVERFTIGGLVAGAALSGSAGLAAFGGAIGLYHYGLYLAQVDLL